MTLNGACVALTSQEIKMSRLKVAPNDKFRTKCSENRSNGRNFESRTQK